MVEKWKKYLLNNFSNSPKAKMMVGVVTMLTVVVIIALTCGRKNIIISIDGNEETHKTYKGTVKEVLLDKDIELSLKDKVQPALDNKISSNDTITIKRAVEVELVVADEVIIIETAEDTIKDMISAGKEELKEKGIEFVEGVDEITPSLDTKIEEGLQIQFVDVEILNEVAIEAIDFETITQEDNNLDINTEEVRQAGVAGEKEITYKIIKKDGKEVARNIIKSKVVKEPVNEIIAEGTRRVFASRDGNIEYKHLIYCESTAYIGGGLTATGTVPVYNPEGISTIAVDPRVIPLGSLVYVENYGKAVAADTGGAIVGNIIDVYLNSHEEASTWGRKYDVGVYILAYPGEW